MPQDALSLHVHLPLIFTPVPQSLSAVGFAINVVVPQMPPRSRRSVPSVEYEQECSSKHVAERVLSAC